MTAALYRLKIDVSNSLDAKQSTCSGHSTEAGAPGSGEKEGVRQ